MSTVLDRATPTPPGGPLPSPEPASRRPRFDLVAAGVAGSTRHPWLVLIAGLLVVAAAVFGLSQGIATTTGEDERIGDSGTAAALISGADFGEAPTETVVITATDGSALVAADVAALGTELDARLSGLVGVADVAAPVISPDASVAIVPVILDASVDDDEAISVAAEQMIAERAALDRENTRFDIRQTGPASVNAELVETIDADFLRAELLALPITLIVLLLAFGAGVAALVPVAIGMASVVTALGLTAALSQVVPVNQNAQSLVLLIGLAVGVDYALFILRRTREERARGLSPRAAVAATGTTAVRAVVISGVTVVVAMAGLLVAGGMFTSLGIGTAAVVLVSVIASATTLPALLAVLGDKVEGLRMPWRRRRAAPAVADKATTDETGEGTSGVWGRLAAAVVRRPLAWGLSATLILLAIAAPALGMRTAIGGTETLPDGFESIEAFDALSAGFPSDGDTVDVVVKAAPGDAGAVSQALNTTRTDAVALGVAIGELDVTESVDGTVHVLHLGAVGDASSALAKQSVDDIRDILVPELSEQLSAAGVDSEIAVGGAIASSVDFTDWLDQRLPLVIGFVLLLTLIVMALSFGSLSLAVATVGLNLLSVGAAYGVLTLVFQGTWAEGLLGFTSTGAIASWLPLMLFVILFGLSMDYHVFVVSRVREAFLAGASPRAAVVMGVARSAGVVTSAAAVMIAVFSIFGTLSMLEMKQMGVGLAAAVLIDATLVRGVLLPAVLASLGRRAHTGPRWLPALHG